MRPLTHRRAANILPLTLLDVSPSTPHQDMEAQAGTLHHVNPHPHAVRRPLTILHTSDLHLGYQFRADNALKGFETVLGAAHHYSADVLLIAGDMFDGRKVLPELVARVLQSLASLECPVLILPGNHDTFLTAPSSPFPHGELPSNVFLLREPLGELVHLDALELSVWGRPVYSHVPEFRPLEGLPPRPDSGWYVAMAHGLVVDARTDPGRSSPILLEDLGQADCDYIALGHLNEFEEVTQGKARACYSGAPWGTRQPTAALVKLDEASGVVVQAIPLP
ncbi:MAG: metallophosphoesterase [Chloroflexota bacterium]